MPLCVLSRDNNNVGPIGFIMSIHTLPAVTVICIMFLHFRAALRQLIVGRKSQQRHAEQSSWGTQRQPSASNVARSSGEFPKRRPWHMRQKRPQLTTGYPAGELPKRRPWFQRRSHDVTDAAPGPSNDTPLHAVDVAPKPLNRSMREENHHEPNTHMLYMSTLPKPDI